MVISDRTKSKIDELVFGVANYMVEQGINGGYIDIDQLVSFGRFLDAVASLQQTLTHQTININIPEIKAHQTADKAIIDAIAKYLENELKRDFGRDLA